MNSVWTDQYPSEYGWSLYGPEQTQNAQEIAQYLVNNGVNQDSAYAILGNMTVESFLNPGIWQYHSGVWVSANSFGLAQWDPSTKYSDYLTQQGLTVNQENMENGYYQLDFLLQDSAQWSTSHVDMNTGWSNDYQVYVPIYPTMQDFFTDTQASVSAKTLAWMVYWERPSYDPNINHMTDRIDYATHWSGSISVFALIWLLAKVAGKWRL